jgi:hypothetical protein
MIEARITVAGAMGMAMAVWGALSGALYGEPYSCGPFLLQPGSEQMTVVIDHAMPLAAKLTYSRADNQGAAPVVVEHEAAARHHVFTLRGLEPDTVYRYRVESGEGQESGERTFRTLPTAPERYRIVAIGDARTQSAVWGRVSQRIHEQERDALFMIGTGDYPENGRQYQLWVEQFFAPGRDLLSRMPLWPAIGNHEGTRPYASGPPPPGTEGSHFFSLFELPGNERWYRVDYQYLTLLVIDSNSRMGPGYGQYEWLRQQLRSERKRFTVVVFHHPPISSSNHSNVFPDGTMVEPPIDEGRRFLLPLFEMYGVDLVLNGHDHAYVRSYRAGTYYVVTAGAGAPLYQVDIYPNPHQQVAHSVHHYLALDIDNRSVTVSAIDIDGKLIDWFVIPVSAGTRARKSHFSTKKFRDQLEFGSIDQGEMTLSVSLRNPLAGELQVSILPETAPQDSMDVPVTEVSLPGKGKITASVSVAGLLPQAGVPAWRGRIGIPLAMRVAGDDDGLPLQSLVRVEVLVREASYDVRRMNPPVVDGDLAEWASHEAMVLDSLSTTIVNRELHRGDDDMTALVWVGWSASALHLAAQVRDDTLTDVPGKPLWQNDSVEIYFDGRREADRTAAYVPLVSQNTFPVLRAVVDKFDGNNSWPVQAIEWAVKPANGGYTLEATIPYALIRGGRGAPAPGERVRFDLMINDRDSVDGSQSHHRLWSRGGRSSNTSGFGLLVLQP